MKRVAIYCGASVGHDPVYISSAISLTRMLHERKSGIVFGGGNVGLMGVIADEMNRLGGEIIGVIPELLVQREVAHQNLTRQIVVKTMHERKANIFELSDAVIAMPGGIGTMEELFEAFTWNQLGIHQLPCAVYNVNGYYDQFHQFLTHMSTSGFLKANHLNKLIFESNPVILLEKLFDGMQVSEKVNHVEIL